MVEKYATFPTSVLIWIPISRKDQRDGLRPIHMAAGVDLPAGSQFPGGIEPFLPGVQIVEIGGIRYTLVRDERFPYQGSDERLPRKTRVRLLEYNMVDNE